MREWAAYRRLPGAESLRVINSFPQLYDRTSATAVDSHYLNSSMWAMRAVLQRDVSLHVDVASSHVFCALLSTVVPVAFIDYRPAGIDAPGFSSVAGDAIRLPFPDASVWSLSCLHAAEHIGLGRYGDPLNPAGTRLAASELARVLSPGGQLLFALPVGRERVCFNAHRILSPLSVPLMFPDLSLAEFSAVLDDGTFVSPAMLSDVAEADYACGLFRFLRR
jgi:hypothetical protein